MTFEDILELLCPVPARAEAKGPPLALPPISSSISIALASGVEDLPGQVDLDVALDRLKRALDLHLGIQVGNGQCCVTLATTEEGAHPEGYRLVVHESGMRIEASSTDGLAHGCSTAAQLFAAASRHPSRSIPGLLLDDEPALEVRGAMLDISRDRVPTMAYLLEVIERLAALKINHLELYVEHTFAFPGHEEVWRGKSPLTSEEVRSLDGYARARGVRLVPNLQSFGHSHRWLKLPNYAHLAEHQPGIVHAFAVDPEPFGLCPVDPASLEHLEDLYDSYLPSFTASEFNVGLDETLDLGLGRSAEACKTRGKGRVYLDFLSQVHSLVTARGRRMSFWGDVILEYPELASELPQDAIAMVWGYEAGHPFEERCTALKEQGLEFRICPGTSSWQSGTGRLENARANLLEAAATASELGAGGLITTDWGDFGHWQPPCTAWPGLTLGAGLAWNPRREPGHLPGILDHAWLDGHERGGKQICNLGRIVDRAGGRSINGAPWFFAIRYAESPFPPAAQVPHFDPEGLAAVAEAGRAPVASDGSLAPGLQEELDWACDLATWASRVAEARVRGGAGLLLSDLPASVRAALVPEGQAVIERLPDVWSLRSRSGGLEDSRGRLERVMRSLKGS